MRAAATALLGLLLLSACSSAPDPAYPVDGRVSLGPFCPVEQPGTPCPTPPQAFASTTVTATSGEQVLSAPVAADGTFRLSLPAGAWQVSADAGMGCQPAAVTVPVSAPVVVECDTGIR